MDQGKFIVKAKDGFVTDVNTDDMLLMWYYLVSEAMQASEVKVCFVLAGTLGSEVNRLKEICYNAGNLFPKVNFEIDIFWNPSFQVAEKSRDVADKESFSRMRKRYKFDDYSEDQGSSEYAKAFPENVAISYTKLNLDAKNDFQLERLWIIAPFPHDLMRTVDKDCAVYVGEGYNTVCKLPTDGGTPDGDSKFETSERKEWYMEMTSKFSKFLVFNGFLSGGTAGKNSVNVGKLDPSVLDITNELTKSTTPREVMNYLGSPPNERFASKQLKKALKAIRAVSGDAKEAFVHLSEDSLLEDLIGMENDAPGSGLEVTEKLFGQAYELTGNTYFKHNGLNAVVSILEKKPIVELTDLMMVIIMMNMGDFGGKAETAYWTQADLLSFDIGKASDPNINIPAINLSNPKKAQASVLVTYSNVMDMRC